MAVPLPLRHPQTNHQDQELELRRALKARQPGALVATRSEDLLFVPKPPSASQAIDQIHRPLRFSLMASGY
ncbi:MAG: hypothetical protein EB123_02145 [Synechococcaceae bacterium WBB_32_011]|nr:hypothetical protein [Synechococcaceae bacterium WBB_32_011]